MLGGFHKSEPLNRKSSVPELLHNWVIANFRKVKKNNHSLFKELKGNFQAICLFTLDFQTISLHADHRMGQKNTGTAMPLDRD